MLSMIAGSYVLEKKNKRRSKSGHVTIMGRKREMKYSSRRRQQRVGDFI